MKRTKTTGKPLTELELKIIRFMYENAEQKLVFPSRRAVAEGLDIHFATVQEYIQKLARKGIIFSD